MYTLQKFKTDLINLAPFALFELTKFLLPSQVKEFYNLNQLMIPEEQKDKNVQNMLQYIQTRLKEEGVNINTEYEKWKKKLTGRGNAQTRMERQRYQQIDAIRKEIQDRLLETMDIWEQENGIHDISDDQEQDITDIITDSYYYLDEMRDLSPIAVEALISRRIDALKDYLNTYVLSEEIDEETEDPQPLEGEGKSKLKLHAIIFSKPYSLKQAQQEAQKIMKSKNKHYYRETSTSYRFRAIPKTKFKSKSYKTKIINPNISLIFGKLK